MPESTPRLTDVELAAIAAREQNATPGPWHVRYLDDRFFANLVAVSTQPDTGAHEPYPDWRPDEMVALTLVQHPETYACICDACWDENADFIAHARTDIPRLLAEVRRLRAALHEIANLLSFVEDTPASVPSVVRDAYVEARWALVAGTGDSGGA